MIEWAECSFFCLNLDSLESRERSLFSYFSDFYSSGRIRSSSITCKSVNSPSLWRLGNTFSLSCCLYSYVHSICVFCLLFLSYLNLFALLFLLKLLCLNNDIYSLLRLIGVSKVCFDILWNYGESYNNREELILFFFMKDFSFL